MQLLTPPDIRPGGGVFGLSLRSRNAPQVALASTFGSRSMSRAGHDAISPNQRQLIYRDPAPPIIGLGWC